ncbi:MAG: hypothetical protein ACLP1X_30705, partial [Polyangiaceae bacterium]
MSCSPRSRAGVWRETWFTTRANTVLAGWFAIAGTAVLASALAAPPAGAQVAGNQSFVTVVVGHRDGTPARSAADPSPLPAEQLLSLSSPVK